MTTTRDDAECLVALRQACTEAGSQNKFALAHNIEPTHLCAMLKGRMPLRPYVAQLVGYERVITYRKQERAHD